MKVVIVGGGFAGLTLANELSAQQFAEVTLVDKNNYHLFSPLLYQVATGFVEASNISYPFRRMFQHRKNLRFHMGELRQIVPEARVVVTTAGILSYDYLVLAMGAKTNYFGLYNVEQHALPMKTLDDALQLRNHLLLNIEKASRTRDAMERQQLLTVVISGGGPTGVEIAGMLAEMKRNILAKDYPELQNATARIHLVTSASVLLRPMSPKAQEVSLSVLSNLGVEVSLNTAVRDYADGLVSLSNGKTIATSNFIWAAGITAADAPGLGVISLCDGKRIAVNSINKVICTSNIYAIGDQCFQSADPKYPKGHPQVVAVAIQQAIHLAANFKRMHSGKWPIPFNYKEKGSMAIIAKYNAVADLPFGSFKGFIAWLLWLVIHIVPIVGFGNKLKLCSNWFWSLITNDPTLRLIIRPGRPTNYKESKYR
jgi:NADH dehydrogenase